MSIVPDAARRLPPGPAQILDVGTASTLEVGLVLWVTNTTDTVNLTVNQMYFHVMGLIVS